MKHYVPSMAFALGALVLFLFDSLIRTVFEGGLVEYVGFLDLFVIAAVFVWAVPWELAWDRYVEIATLPPPPEE